MGSGVIAVASIWALLARGGAGVPYAALCWTFGILLSSGSGRTLESTELVPLFIALSSIPVAAAIAGQILERIFLGDARIKFFPLLATVTSVTYLFSTNTMFSLLEAVANIVSRNVQPSASLLFGLNVISATIFCVSVVVCSGTLIVLAFELPLRWIFGAKRLPLDFDFRPLRILIVLVSFIIIGNLIAGLFTAELGPNRLLSYVSNA